jgi:hypothetical protein
MVSNRIANRVLFINQIKFKAMKTKIEIKAGTITSGVELMNQIASNLGFSQTISISKDNPNFRFDDIFSNEPATIELPHEEIEFIISYNGNDEASSSTFYKLV